MLRGSQPGAGRDADQHFTVGGRPPSLKTGLRLLGLRLCSSPETGRLGLHCLIGVRPQHHEGQAGDCDLQSIEHSLHEGIRELQAPQGRQGGSVGHASSFALHVKRFTGARSTRRLGGGERCSQRASSVACYSGAPTLFLVTRCWSSHTVRDHFLTLSSGGGGKSFFVSCGAEHVVDSVKGASCIVPLPSDLQTGLQRRHGCCQTFQDSLCCPRLLSLTRAGGTRGHYCTNVLV